MRTLWFLWSKQVINGIKRAVKSPRRLIGMLLGLGYFVGFFIRPWDKSPTGFEKLSAGIKPLDPTNVAGVSFLGFLFFSLVLSMAVLNFKNTFRPADIDVLFPTPVPSRLVMIFRLFRDYAGTFLLPFVFAIFGYRPASGFIQNWQKGDAAGMFGALRGLFIAWVLLSLAWISISYATSFFIARNEAKGDRFARIIGWGIAAITLLALAMYPLNIYLAIKAQESEWQAVLNVTNSIWMKVFFFLPHAATNVVLGSYTGSLIPVFAGLLVLVGVSVGCLSFAAKNSDWMYDQAATKGAQATKVGDMMRKGDASGLLAERAREGKIKRGRIATKVSNMTLRNGWALIYKELLIQARTGIATTIFFMLMVSLFAVMFAMIPTGSSSNPSRRLPAEFAPMLYLGLVGFLGANMSSATAYNGFAETLRRVEIVKPLPLNARQIAFYETISKSIFAGIVIIVPFFVGFCVKPSWWQYHFSGMIAGPTLAMAMVAMMFLNIVLFPDLEDMTQRSFRGFTQLIGMAIVFMPTFLLFVGSYFLKTSPLIPALFSAGINLGVTLILATFAGRFYADFNPSE